MIVYRELPSLVRDLGFSAKTLYSVGNNLSRHYHSVQIPKGKNDYRELSVPDELLKRIQAQIYKILLYHEPVSPYATAYRPGGSTRRNAAPHTGKSVVLKLDIRHFFDSVIYALVKEKVFPTEKYSEPNRVLLSVLCTYKDALPQGAPTSPVVSNIILRDFDDTVGNWCKSRNVTYTRYCDDMTFSGEFEPKFVIEFVKTELRRYGLFLNDRKTVTIRKGRRQCITGIVVNEVPHVPSEYKRKIRQEMYYCSRYGMEQHIRRICPDKSAEAYAASLLGRINYVLSVEPENREMHRCRELLKELITE